jgi:hypothetical protein
MKVTGLYWRSSSPFGIDMGEVIEGAPTIVPLNVCDAVWPAVSVSFIVKLNEPAVVGVPEIVMGLPVVPLRDVPFGNVPEEMDHVYGDTPPEAVHEPEKGTVTSPLGDEVVHWSDRAGLITSV